MIISDSSSTTIDIRLTEVLTTGAGGVGDRSGLLVQITTEDGQTGNGETAPIPGFDGPKLEEIAVAIDAWQASAAGTSVADALDGLDGVETLARFAIHTALLDLQSKEAGVPAAQWLRTGAPSTVKVNGLVAEASPGEVHTRTSALVASGMQAIKLKVGVADSGQDVTRIIAASEAAGPGVALRLDANGAWDLPTAEKVVGRVGRHRIDFVEDPTRDVSDYRKIEAATGVPVALDLPVTNDPLREIDAAQVSIAVVKPAAVGGIDRVLALARSRESLRVVVSSSIDREIALAAAVHAAAALPDDSEAHGLATGSLVRQMPEALLARRGAIDVPAESGGVWVLAEGAD